MMQIENMNHNLQTIAASLYKLEVIANEIIEFSHQDECDVWKKMSLEIENPGYNVCLSSVKYGVTPHEFDDNMLRFYQESDGFIYETLIESRNPHRVQKWINIVNFMLSVSSEETHTKKVLLYGDSVGSDSIFLKNLGFDVYYHDFDSYCSKFANDRFNKRNLKIKKFSGGLEKFDFVLCLEVAEHVPEPMDLIKELSLLTSDKGYCIFSEAFHLVNENFPTHLRSNLKFDGKTDELFRDVKMNVLWRDIHDKPIVYTKWARQNGDNPNIKFLKNLARKFLKLIKP